MLVIRGLYRRWLTKYFSALTLAGLAPDDEPILLRRIYVPLVLTEKRVSDYADERQIHHSGREFIDRLGSLVQGQVLLLSGEAGSGKTTLVSAVVDSLAGEVGDDLNQRFEGWVPFPIRLREAPLDRLHSLDGLIDWWLEQARCEVPDLAPRDLCSFLDMGRGILLLDGLDEVGSQERRACTMRWLRNHRWVQCPNLVIVTARPSGFEGLKQEDLPPVRSLFVAPFSHEQIRTYLTRWFELRPLRSDQRQNTVENLVARLTSSEQSGRLLPLARRPAYLASLAFVHGTRGELPYTRAALYEQLVEAYIEMLDRQKGVLDRAERVGELPVWDRQEKIEVLSAVAFQAHVGATVQQKQKPSWEHKVEDRRLLWNRAELEEAVRVAVEDGAERFRSIRPEYVSQLTGYFVARTGLLVETREGQYQFGHLSFQEYLTALFILNRAAAGRDKAGELERILFPRLGEPGWLEVGVLVLAIDANRSGGKGHEPVLARLNLTKPEQLALLAQLLSGEEIRFTVEERRALVLVWLAFWANRLEDSDLDSVLRFPSNREALEDAWKAVCAALEERRPALTGLSGLVERALNALERPAPSSRGSLGALVGPVVETLAAREAWSRFPGMAEPDLPAARLLLVPLLGGFLPAEADTVLAPLPGRAELFRRPEPGWVQPAWIQHSLDSWSLKSDSLLRSLAEQTPLLWWLQDDFFALRVSSADRQSIRTSFILWRSELWRRLLRIEQGWWTSRLSAQDVELRSDLVHARARDSAPARDLARVRDWDVARDQARDRDRIRARELIRDRDLALDMDLARKLDEPLASDLALAGDLALDLNIDRDLARDLELLVDVLDQMKKIPRRNSPDQNKKAIVLFQAALQSVSLGWLLSDPAPVRRSDLVSSLATFRTPETVIAPLHGTPFAEQALQEWEEVLASPFSPIPLLEEALSREWDELPADAKGIARLFEAAVAKIATSS
jgi:DNA polymerase III delta prime subunit